jgi:agmatine deiminase
VNVFYHHHPTNDAWCRDHGPIFLQRETAHGKEEAIVDWGYNAWGDKYPPYDLDDVIPTLIAEEFGLPVFHPGIVMEGGSLDVNGAGTLLTTEACLLNPNRNPHLSRDDITRFVGPHTVVTVVEDDPRDENYEPLQDNLKRLRTMKDQDGQALEVITLPMPRPLEHDGQRLPASYANFYIANGVVLLPTYDRERDPIAIDVLQRCFPDRRVVGIDCTDLVWGLGAFHCVSQQWPAL